VPTVKTRIEADPVKIERFRGRLSESDHPHKQASFGNLSGLVDVALDVASSALEANPDRAQVAAIGRICADGVSPCGCPDRALVGVADGR